MRYMFSGCTSLTNIDLSNFITQNVTDMRSMFHGCNSLTNIDLSNFIQKMLLQWDIHFVGIIFNKY